MIGPIYLKSRCEVRRNHHDLCQRSAVACALGGRQISCAADRMKLAMIAWCPSPFGLGMTNGGSTEMKKKCAGRLDSQESKGWRRTTS
ncbi:hypothetical protein BGLA2_700011 [Burkholderia gladioli]|nr:hypothetical protein BGLA2_700011 [Burkholderia gladioli]